MSIYATVGEIGIRRFGDKEFIDIFIQGVPPHIDHAGPEWDFLPPPVDPEGQTMRAVFFVERGDEKGTDRCGQEYVKPLLMLAGKEYEEIRFVELMTRLEEALDKRYGSRPPMIFRGPDGKERNIY
jgi:hypothetical protein